jgi:diguanylate cyclase (GGDEF)-like protein
MCRITQQELYEYCKQNGALMVQAHPLRPNFELMNVEYLDGVELNLSSRDFVTHSQVEELADKYSLPLTVGSDYHEPFDNDVGGIIIPDEITNSVELCNYLKQANDTYGHAFGNQLIIATATVLTEIFQHSNVYRIGGDEFVVLLDGEDYEIRYELISQLEERSASLTIPTRDGEEFPVSFAFGMATYTKELDAGVDDVLKHADSAMYLHKRNLKRLQLQSHAHEA